MAAKRFLTASTSSVRPSVSVPVPSLPPSEAATAHDFEDRRHYDDPFYRRLYRQGRCAKRAAHISFEASPPEADHLRASSSNGPVPGSETVDRYWTRERRHMESAWEAGQEPIMYDSSQGGTDRPLGVMFPGSASQYSGMGQTLLDKYASARHVWEEAEDALAGFESWRKDLMLHEEPALKGLDLMSWSSWVQERPPDQLRKIVFGGAQDQLTRSSNAQPAILITSMAFLRVLEKEYETPVSSMASVFAGHSSGEYSAAVAAGAISFADGVRLTRLHGLLTSRLLYTSDMQPFTAIDAPRHQRAQMSAILVKPGHSHDEVKEIVDKVAREEKLRCEVASYNSSSQVILSGTRKGILLVTAALHDAGIASHGADLPVHCCFHCSFMRPAAEGMAIALSRGVDIKAPRAPLLSGVISGLVRSPKEVADHLVDQIDKPVRWADGLKKLRQEGVGRMIFIGPGKALANLARRDQERGYWKDEKDSTKGKVEIGSVATQDDLARVKEMFKTPSKEQTRA